ncbi:16S rRNA (guanine(966)-N(2))-methyltransferase RsmD [Silanimonas sp.]|jgi:16S rRNA (guanine966-N2)-methyltransferase|uniref:16S rRNA (guanine(966)-N(2))-methyltransferase RsmD n=1 Tax=Silanimonas sp. TaxID=1929290 RepID=UPI0022C52761|nr:16S rRNA (guanine(966)-N(2))-methyltransferase RsmD [Silanimonas sp.]MCZ8116465.1 16S rRNA (guanine(966)-N(2))-methyltransferase RsmD [Silanimonas sp.]
MKPRIAAAPAAAGQVRLIGGAWRGSKLPVPALPGLRPTSDRVRETLFNWLHGELAGARVLDLFAGTGALGFEAASRGAASVDLVERAPLAVDALRNAAARLGRDGSGGPVQIHAQAATAFLAAQAGPWDLVFVDPPFEAGLWAEALGALGPRLAPRALVYVESPAGALPAVPAAWVLQRETATREVRAALYKVEQG